MDVDASEVSQILDVTGRLVELVVFDPTGNPALITYVNKQELKVGMVGVKYKSSKEGLCAFDCD